MGQPIIVSGKDMLYAVRMSRIIFAAAIGAFVEHR